MENSKQNWSVGYKEVKNFMHNELGITKEMIDEIIKKMVRDEVSEVIGQNGQFIRQSIREIIREEMLFAINGEKYPRQRGNLLDYRNEFKGEFSKFISDILKEEVLDLFRSQFNVGVNIEQNSVTGDIKCSSELKKE